MLCGIGVQITNIIIVVLYLFFDILFELTKRFEGTEYNSFHARYPGRISEVLLDVWMNENGYTYKEVPFVYMEKINMFKKGMGFLKAKFLHKKYGESF